MDINILILVTGMISFLGGIYYLLYYFGYVKRWVGIVKLPKDMAKKFALLQGIMLTAFGLLILIGISIGLLKS